MDISKEKIAMKFTQKAVKVFAYVQMSEADTMANFVHQLEQVLDASEKEQWFKDCLLTIGSDFYKVDVGYQENDKGYERFLRNTYVTYLKIMKQKFPDAILVFITGPIGTQVIEQLGGIEDKNIIHIGIPQYHSTGNNADYIELARDLVRRTDAQLDECA